YHVSVEDTVRNAAKLVRAGAQAVKLEGGRKRVDMVKAIVDAEMPVMGHVGLTPQSIHALGGFKVQGKQAAAAAALVDDAVALAEYADDVRARRFPSEAESYHLNGEVAEALGLYGAVTKTA